MPRAANYGVLAKLDVDKTIARLAQGTLLRQIASEYGVDKTAVHKKVKTHPDYPQAIIDQAESFVEQAMQQLFDPNLPADEVNIARARVDAAHKWAAARDPSRWAAKSHVTVDINVDLGDRLSRATERIVDVSHSSIEGETTKLLDLDQDATS